DVLAELLNVEPAGVACLRHRRSRGGRFRGRRLRRRRRACEERECHRHRERPVPAELRHRPALLVVRRFATALMPPTPGAQAYLARRGPRCMPRTATANPAAATTTP